MSEDLNKSVKKEFILSTFKKNIWNTVVLVTTVTLLIMGWLHSMQSAENYIGGLLFIVLSLIWLVAIMNVISFILAVIHLVRNNWSRFFVTLAMIVVSISLWIITMLYVDSSLVLI